MNTKENLIGNFLSKGMIEQTNAQGLVLSVFKMDKSAISNPRVDSDSTWVGVDDVLHHHDDMDDDDCVEGAVRFYCSSKLNLPIESFHWSIVYSARKLKDDKKIMFSAFDHFDKEYGKSSYAGFILKHKSADDKVDNIYDMRDMFDHELKLYATALNGDMFDVYLTDFSGKVYDKVLEVSNTYETGVEDYCEEMTIGVEEDYLSGIGEKGRTTLVNIDISGSDYKKISFDSFGVLLSWVNKVFGEHFLVSVPSINLTHQIASFNVAVSTIPSLKKLNYICEDNFNQRIVAEFEKAFKLTGEGDNDLSLLGQQFKEWLMQDRPYNEWSQTQIIALVTAIIQYAAMINSRNGEDVPVVIMNTDHRGRPNLLAEHLTQLAERNGDTNIQAEINE